MARPSDRKPLKRGEKMLLAAPLFVLLILGAMQFGNSWRERWFPQTFTVDGNVSFLRFSPDSRVLTAAFYKNNSAQTAAAYSVTVWDIKSGAVLWTSPCAGWIGGIDFSPNGRLLSVALPTSRGVANSTILVFDTRTGQRLWRASLPGYADGGVFSPDGRNVISQGETVRIYDSITGKLRRALPVQCKTSGQWLRFTRDGKKILMLQSANLSDENASSQVQIWDIQSGNLIRKLPPLNTLWADLPKGHDNAVTLGRPLSEAQRTASQGALQIWNVANGKLKKTLPGLDTASDFTKWRCLSRDGNLLFRMKIADDSASSSTRKVTRVELLDLKSGQIQWSQPTKNTPFFCRFAPDLKTVCSSETVHDNSDDRWSGSGTVHLWDVKTGEELRSWRVSSTYAPVDYSPDSHFLSFFDDGKIYLWNTKFFTGKL